MIRNHEIWLIRHGEVEARWKGICYGAMDVSLSEVGKKTSDQMAGQLCNGLAPKVVYHSGLRRTRYLADQIASLGSPNIEVREDTRLRERNYGRWQGLSWDAAYASDPDHFHDLIEKPDTYRPPDGETTSEMQLRIIEWLSEIEAHSHPVVVISHSGPIAAIAGHVQGLPSTEWNPWFTKNLEGIRLRKDKDHPRKWLVEGPFTRRADLKSLWH